jgi:hypothetical protein
MKSLFIIITSLGILSLLFVVLNKFIKHHFLKSNYEHKITSFVYLFLRIYVVISMVISIYLKSYYHAFLCAVTLILFFIPSLIERKFKLEIPQTMEIIILLFIFAAEMLGEINSFYVKIPMWDSILHTINGFLCAAIGYAMVDLLNTNDKFSMKLSPIFLVLVSFCFSMTIGVLWEFFEFSADRLFQFDMQKDSIVYNIHSVYLNPDNTNQMVNINNIDKTTIQTKDGTIITINGYLDIGLIDTMNDLIVNFIGAVVFSVFGYLLKNEYIMKHFVVKIKDGK